MIDPQGLASTVFASEVLRVCHGISCRTISEGNRSEESDLAGNMSPKCGPSERALESRAIFCRSLGIDSRSLLFPRQIHGSKVAAIGSREQLEDPETIQALADGDGIVTSVSDLPIGILVADCTPVFIHDPVSSSIGLVHAGWRGTVDGIVPNAIRAMQAQFGAQPEDCRVWIGPCIGPCCFEVGDEVTRAFQERLDHLGTRFGDHIDLKQVNRRLLIQERVASDNIDISGVCTYCDRRFFSHRRATHKGLSGTGRMMAVMTMVGE